MSQSRGTVWPGGLQRPEMGARSDPLQPGFSCGGRRDAVGMLLDARSFQLVAAVGVSNPQKMLLSGLQGEFLALCVPTCKRTN